MSLLLSSPHAGSLWCSIPAPVSWGQNLERFEVKFFLRALLSWVGGFPFLTADAMGQSEWWCSCAAQVCKDLVSELGSDFLVSLLAVQKYSGRHIQSRQPLELWWSLSHRSPQHKHSDSCFGELQLLGFHRFGFTLTYFSFCAIDTQSEPFELLALTELSSCISSVFRCQWTSWSRGLGSHHSYFLSFLGFGFPSDGAALVFCDSNKLPLSHFRHSCKTGREG